MRRIINASNFFGSMAFLSMILATAAYEGGLYITSVALAIVFAGSAWLALKEDGKKIGPSRRPKHRAYKNKGKNPYVYCMWPEGKSQAKKSWWRDDGDEGG